MFQSYEEALNWIHSRLRLGVKPGLKRMEWMMDKLDHPEKKIPTIHIGGTNGKGSTVTYLRSILQASGLKVGTFTSPYFEHFNERISINGHSISEEDLVKITNVIKPLSDELEQTELGSPTEFEVITAMSFYYFAEVAPVDLAIYEVGLGGRFDSTNIITPQISIITSIGLDHINILGNSYEQIAFEKAGIIKPGIPILTAVKQPEAFNVIREKAAQMDAAIHRLGEHFFIDHHVSLENGERFSLQTSKSYLENLEIRMLGQHQTENAALAVEAAILLAASYKIAEEDIRQGLKKAYWPGRFEIVSSSPLIVLDGAHNEEGIETLVVELKRRFPGRKKRLIFAALGDKKVDNMIKKLDSVSQMITFVSFDFPRAANAEELYQFSSLAHKRAESDWQKAISEELRALESNEMLIITGSLYFLSEVKPYINTFI
ncbi:bifunctional folylpolyglutamate synthase/dihydrofolate synthase [Robertmurraya siralis]|uniref:Dihydrofolate synthase/folylpolyglutamate synthase n=1 Tax=Robertmurraya siralis TaxID=77777 RepID=A0A920BS10_9BACI|nr:folylpolyglutamate synthase/dihydrofolate synthase family protein [Robertmurraya siralis]GIN60274.1 bifunctional folylpolyglutamate synthase/dihydrofolate synthase [Robertmurraya siralis]